MTKRGLMVSGQGRYLFEPSVGEILAEVGPYDRVADTSRWAFSWKHNQQFAPWLNGYLNYNRVSDSTYFADFSDRIAVTSQKTLPQEAGLNANYGPFDASLVVQSFQTLQDPSAPVTPATPGASTTWAPRTPYRKPSRPVFSYPKRPWSTSAFRWVW